jgi:hypothetical protein
VDPRGDSESTGDAVLDDDCWNEVNCVDSCFIGNDKIKWGKGKKFYTYSTQMTKYSDNCLGLLAQQGTQLYSMKHGTVSLQIKF